MVRVRFAPSPTGVPHIGNTRTALFNYLFAKHHRGRFILRIEDTDRDRLVPESLPKILQILKAVGIHWDEGPYIQSKRLKIYRRYAETLIKTRAAYYCFCSRERLIKLRPRYDRHCLQLTPVQIQAKLKAKKPFVIRLKVPQTGTTGWQDLIQAKIEFKNQLLDDQVLLKSDGFPTYHLAVVVDDHLMKISHILRGVEWISSTPKHLLLYQAFNWPVPQIGHFPIILGPDKAKLSKRHGAKSILDYQAEGYLAEALITFMAYLGWSYQDNSQLLTLPKLIKLFELDHIGQANPIFDLNKLDYFNAKLIRQTPLPKLIQLIKPFCKAKLSDEKLTRIVPLIQERLVKLSQVNELTDFFSVQPKPDPQLLLTQTQKSRAEVKAVLSTVCQAFSSLKDSAWQADKLEQIGHQLLKQTGWTPRQLFMTIRVALTGKTATPPLFDIMSVLGKKTCRQRLETSLSNLKPINYRRFLP